MTTRKPLVIGRPQRDVDYPVPCGEDAANGCAADPETRMWRAVAAQSFIDAFVASDTALASSEGPKTFPAEVAQRVRSEARKWLVADSGTWRRAREAVCINADLCPDRVRRAALALIAAQDRGEDPRKLLGRNNGRKAINNGSFELAA